MVEPAPQPDEAPKKCGFVRNVGGYVLAVGSMTRRLKRTQMYEWMRLKGYVAFNLPRVVTGLGAGLLSGIAAVHVYVLVSRPALSAVFAVYTGLVVAWCLLAVAAMGFAANPRIPQLGWFVGDAVSIVYLAVYLATRPTALPGLVAVTGRWDFAPGTLAGALALGFVAVHMSVLLGINVAYPQRQQWSD
jgi:hypothetical protein